MANFAALQADVARRIMRTDMTDQIKSYLNTVQQKVARLDQRWFDLDVWDKTSLATVPSQEYVVPPTDMVDWYRLVLIDGTSSYILAFVLPYVFSERYANPVAYGTSKPACYTHVQGKFWLAPVPDTIYALYIHYKKMPSDMTADGNTPTISGSDEVLILGACALCHEQVGEFDRAQYFWARFGEEVGLLIERAEAQKAYIPSGEGRGYGAVPSETLDYRSPWFQQE